MPVDEYFLSGIIWTAICFTVGVSWSAYRAVGWVERMREWSSSACDALIEVLDVGGVPVGVPDVGPNPDFTPAECSSALFAQSIPERGTE